jgi:hypothetical protein
MKQPKLSDITAERLVEYFETLALEQHRSIDDVSKYRRLYWELEAVEHELKRRSGDERRALIRLYDHQNAQVRLKAAIATLALAPDEARRVLQLISDRDEYPQAADARGMLMALDQGRYVPD